MWLYFLLDTLVLIHIYILCLFNVIYFFLVGAEHMDSETGSSVGLTTREALSRLRQDIETVVDEYEEFRIKR
jgi:hypothetical protein